MKKNNTLQILAGLMLAWLTTFTASTTSSSVIAQAPEDCWKCYEEFGSCAWTVTEGSTQCGIFWGGGSGGYECNLSGDECSGMGG